MHHAALVVPGLAELAAAADVGDGVGDATVEEGEAVGGKGGGEDLGLAK